MCVCVCVCVCVSVCVCIYIKNKTFIFKRVIFWFLEGLEETETYIYAVSSHKTCKNDKNKEQVTRSRSTRKNLKRRFYNSTLIVNTSGIINAINVTC